MFSTRPYANPAAVGYLASLHLLGWCIGFVRLDGSLVTRW